LIVPGSPQGSTRSRPVHTGSPLTVAETRATVLGGTWPAAPPGVPHDVSDGRVQDLRAPTPTWS
jgi:hypothetical protein